MSRSYYLKRNESGKECDSPRRIIVFFVEDKIGTGVFIQTRRRKLTISGMNSVLKNLLKNNYLIKRQKKEIPPFLSKYNVRTLKF